MRNVWSDGYAVEFEVVWHRLMLTTPSASSVLEADGDCGGHELDMLFAVFGTHKTPGPLLKGDHCRNSVGWGPQNAFCKFCVVLELCSLGRVVLYTVFICVFSARTLVKTLANNLVKHLA